MKVSLPIPQFALYFVNRIDRAFKRRANGSHDERRLIRIVGKLMFQVSHIHITLRIRFNDHGFKIEHIAKDLDRIMRFLRKINFGQNTGAFF